MSKLANGAEAIAISNRPLGWRPGHWRGEPVPPTRLPGSPIWTLLPRAHQSRAALAQSLNDGLTELVRLVQHEEGEGGDYPVVVAQLMGGEDPMGTMERAHMEIERPAPRTNPVAHRCTPPT